MLSHLACVSCVLLSFDRHGCGIYFIITYQLVLFLLCLMILRDELLNILKGMMIQSQLALKAHCR